jgi:hypothetical protein
VPAYPPIPQPVPAFWTTYGHSFYQGSFGSHNPQGRADSIIRNLFGTHQVTHSRNQAAVGSRVTFAGLAQAGWARVMQNERGNVTNPGYPDVAGSGAYFLGWGINDVGFNGQTVQNNNAYIQALRACISRCRCSRVWEANSAAFTYGASFTAQNFAWENSSGDSYFSATVTTTATVSWTIPADYKGGTIAFLFLSTPGVKGATFTWGGTAGVTGTTSTSNILPAGLATAKTALVRRITNLTAANAGQTITLAANPIDGGGGSADFGGCWIETPLPPPVLVANAPRLNALGYLAYQGTYASSLNATAVASTPATITLASGTTNGLAAAGFVTCPSAGGTVTISYTGLTASALTGCTAAGGSGNYTSSTLTWAGPVDTDINAFNAYLPPLVAEFDSMVRVVDLDSAIGEDPVALGSDGLHPSEWGAARIADAFYVAYQNLAPASMYGEASQMNVPNQALVPLILPKVAGRWYDTPALGGPNGTAYAAVAQDLFAIPVTCTKQGEIWFQWSVETLAGSAAATIEFAIYDDRAQQGWPKYLYSTPCSGPLTLATGAAVFTSTGSAGNGFLNAGPDPGLYWLALRIATAGTGVTFRTMKGPSLLMPTPQGGVTAYCGWKLTGKASMPLSWDFPSTPALNTPVDNCPRIQLSMF